MNFSSPNIYDWESNSEIRNFVRNHDWIDCEDSNKAKWLRAVSNGIIVSATITHEIGSDTCVMSYIKELPECIYKTEKLISISGLNDFLDQFNN